MHGQSYHRIGNVLPHAKGKKQVDAQFLALYFYDPELGADTQLDKRARGSLDTPLGRKIMAKLQDMIKK